VLPHFTREILDERNAQHAEEFAGCTREETIALHKQGAAVAADIVRGLSDAALAKRGVVFVGQRAHLAPGSASRSLDELIRSL
jgi:mevalonate pyrophosphate decarboxylase